MAELEPLYTAEEMRAAEAGHDVDAMMKRAGAAVAEELMRRFPDALRIALHAGGGANGGDGRIAAEILQAQGREIVEKSYAAFKLRMSGGSARSWERNGAKLFANILVMRSVLSEARGREREGKHSNIGETGFHGQLRMNESVFVRGIDVNEGTTMAQSHFNLPFWQLRAPTARGLRFDTVSIALRRGGEVVRAAAERCG